MIAARDTMMRALVGSAVEVSGFRPLFPDGSDDVAHTIVRVGLTWLVFANCVDSPPANRRGMISRAALPRRVA